MDRSHEANKVASGPLPVPARLAAAARGQSQAWSLLLAMRLRQWLKNGLVVLPFVFSVGEAWRLADSTSWMPLLARVLVATLAFCAVSSAGYLVNDVLDAERDRQHPRKRHRPVASGAVTTGTATAAALALFAAGLGLGATLGGQFMAVLAGYVLLTLAYSFVLKHIAIVELFAIALGFVVRAVAGGVAISVPISPWLYLCTLLGALFIAITKRRQELVFLGDTSSDHRPILDGYNVGLLDQMTSIVTSSTIIAYAIYTVTAPNLPANGSMLITVPFVLYGIFRYLSLVDRDRSGASPEEVLLQDRPLQLALAGWMATAVAVLVLFRS